MSILRTKSDENIKAARELMNHTNCYTASVHCSYYACFQLIVYLLKVEHKINDSRKWRDLGSNEGSHEQTINLLFKELKAKEYKSQNSGQKGDKEQKTSTPNSTHFFRYMGSLRNYRNNADYFETLIDEPYGRCALNGAEAVRKLLLSIYELTP